ncbi:MAG: efflux RND transporter periplasmic adaptor subunit [Sphingomonadaceae bacterium]|nr:efflux RND transporter periplasmic adaptor subunit [Sphingomonadaceae bacterium]
MNDQHSDYAPVEVERSPRARRNALLTLLALVVLGVAIWALVHAASGGNAQAGAGGGRSGKGRPAATVGTAKVTLGSMPETIGVIGTVQPIVSATVKPQLSGNIFTINFKEGQIVSKGQMLAQVDPRPYRLALSQAQANLAKDQATLNLARVDLRRYQTLLAQDSIARQQVDTQAATVKQDEATVAADQAAVGTARLNLRYTSITAPVSGRIGLRQVDIGNYVTPGDANGVAIITETDPIDVSFAVPQANLPDVLARRRTGANLPATASDQTGTTPLAQGSFLTFDNQIDATTGTVKAKARFPNRDGKLFPNQFVNLSLLVDTLQNVTVVPVTAVRHGPQGDFVFVLQPNETVKLQVVKLGPQNGATIAILSGLQQGQTVVIEGADNLDDGSKVTLPGQQQHRQRPKKTGLFAWLFGSGDSGGGQGDQSRQAQGNAQDGAADGNSAEPGGHHHRHRGQGGGDSANGGGSGGNGGGQ